MTADWTFLEPWHTALSVTTELSPRVPADSGTVMNVSITWPYLHSPCLQLYVELHLEDRNPQDMIQLKQIREAIELFTALSLMNNKVFREQFPHFTRSRGQGEGIWYPVWNLHVSGSLTAQNVAWSRLLDDLEPSPQFQSAIRMTKAVEAEDKVKFPDMEWKCEFDGAVVEAALAFDHDDKDARRLFDAGASMISHLSLTPHTATLVDIWHNQRPVSAHLTLSIRDSSTPFCRDLAAGLVRTPINYLIIIFEGNATNDAQAMMHVGVLMKRIYQWSQVASDRIDITCDAISPKVSTAICSAISVGSTSTPIEITFESVSTVSWPWLLYALSCSPSPNISLTISDVGLTKSDLSRISGVLRCNYPHSKGPRNTFASSFGFVDITEGTTLWCLDPEGSPFTVPNSVRCRAWFKEENTVEVVIPGIGLCRSRIRDGVSVASRDIEEKKTLKASALRSLFVSFTPIESVSLVTNLLELIGGNLRSLSLRIPPDSSDRALDLSVLSAVCPNLESLTTYVFDVVASIHNEALRLWPIKMMYITDSRKLADIPACLRNPNLRMARELERLAVNFYKLEFDERDTQEVRAHDGDFLSVVKEPFPIHSKAAMISVVNSAHNSKAVHRLHADVLRIIFVLASMPAQRSVDFWARRRR